MLDRRTFIEILLALGVGGGTQTAFSSSPNAALPPGGYRPGRIDNDYSRLLPGEVEALRRPPTVSAITSDSLVATLNGRTVSLKVHDQLGGWHLIALVTADGAPAAVFEKHVTHRGAIAWVAEAKGVLALIPKQIGELANIRPRAINTPHGIELKRLRQFGPDPVGAYILNSSEDPCYENVAALGEEYIGWTLVANEEAGAAAALYLEPFGRSRERTRSDEAWAFWAPDAFDLGSAFDPMGLMMSSPGEGAWSKRTLLGGDLPVADIGVWDPDRGVGYEVIVLLPPGKEAKPMARIRASLTSDQMASLDEIRKSHPEWITRAGLVFYRQDDQDYLERYWQSGPVDFHRELAGLWKRWRAFHDQAMQVDIPDEWLLNAARAGITLARCSYTGLEPSYQVGEGGYTKVPPSSHALFPVAHYEFVWAHQLWGHTDSADAYFQHYLEHYVLPDGNFTYNTQDQVEAPLNIGLFLANSARSYLYNRNIGNLDKRLPILDRMIQWVLARYDEGRRQFPIGDRRRGLIWGSPEADLGDPHRDGPDAHPYYYQNAVCVWRGLREHVRALRQAGRDLGRADLSRIAAHYDVLAKQMRADIQASIQATLAACNPAMRSAGITPFTPDDIDRAPSKLGNYENHRMMEDWFLADWGDAALDRGHLEHRRLAGRELLGLGTSHEPCMTSNFMAHGTLSVLIRHEDYRPYLLSLYALVCYAADSGNRYSPEDAVIPGGRPLNGNLATWSAVINSTLQPALGLRWLLCYEESDEDICHLQKAAPKHWFSTGRRIAVQRCPTRFGHVSWSTMALAERRWQVSIEPGKGFAADLKVHVHPSDGGTLRTTSLGRLERNAVVIARSTLSSGRRLEIELT